MSAPHEDVVVEDLSATDWDQMVTDLTAGSLEDVDGLDIQGCNCGACENCGPSGSAGVCTI